MPRTASPSPLDWSRWSAPMLATLLFIIRDGQVLLIEKKTGLGAGKINGPGGKIEPGETPLEAIIRETQEELMIVPHQPRKIGELWFDMTDCPNIQCHVFRADHFSGIPTETAEAAPLWTPLANIPYERMWQDDRYWMPLLIAETPFLGKFIFTGEKMQWMHLATDIRWE